MELNRVFPFLWIHGEDEATYRKMVNVIHDANMKAFCVEARPHPDFAGEQWWKDLGILLDEAEKLGMQVWILDDKHFPTGYAAGALENAPLDLKRRHLTHHSIAVKGGTTLKADVAKNIKSNDPFNLMSFTVSLYFNHGLVKKVNQDALLSVTAWNGDRCVNIMDCVRSGKLLWTAPEGEWTVEFVGLTYDAGAHPAYINMLDEASCQKQIDAVYQPHWEHFSDKFGKTIVGFFSDEPELGNGMYINFGNVLGSDQTLPYSESLAKQLEAKWGRDWTHRLPLLWKQGKDAPQVRYDYMDCVTRLVESCFSKKVGDWCQEHGVEYIGHVIEDCNQHARTSTSLGHYFRGLKYQTMAGIDDIGGQVRPQGEDANNKTMFGYNTDGEFYHYSLGKLGVSMAELNPRMQGRTMCEIFGNYGWEEGVRLEKYLLDHFLVRGVNHYVPHAFTCKAYPEPDCPPHFYAMGNNPQYKHFGALMRYADRVTGLISGGQIDAKVAILYHGESEWMGDTMFMQKPARQLYDHRIDYRFVPSDVFAEPEFYHTEITDKLTVNGKIHDVFVVPSCAYISAPCADGLSKLIENGGRVIFVDELPRNVETDLVPEAFLRAERVPLASLAQVLCGYDIPITPANDRIRILHYLGDTELYMLVNESTEDWTGSLDIPGQWHSYDAWTDTHSAADLAELTVKPYESLILLPGALEASPALLLTELKLKHFERSTCRAIDYPAFTGEKSAPLGDYTREDPKFSGFIRYRTGLKMQRADHVELQINGAQEGTEVFVNGISCGIQVTPNPVFDITQACRVGKNLLCIEVATTLARERGKKTGETGITGDVILRYL